MTREAALAGGARLETLRQRFRVIGDTGSWYARADADPPGVRSPWIETGFQRASTRSRRASTGRLVE